LEPNSKEVTVATILIVEDDPLHQAYLLGVLQEAGFDCRVCGDGGKAWDRLGGGMRVDLLLTDVGLPTLSGLELVARVRKNPATAALPIVVRSAMEAGRGEVRAAAAGADAFVSKGVAGEVLLQLIRTLLRLHRTGVES